MILGIDPGYSITGFSVISDKQPSRILDCGVIRTTPDLLFSARLATLQIELESILDRFKPLACSIEKVFFSVNKKSAMEVAQARGVVVATVARRSIPIYEYSPSQIKKAVTGSGRANKEDIAFMIKKLFSLKEVIAQDDACDAVAIAFCHLGTGMSVNV